MILPCIHIKKLGLELLLSVIKQLNIGQINIRLFGMNICNKVFLEDYQIEKNGFNFGLSI